MVVTWVIGFFLCGVSFFHFTVVIIRMIAIFPSSPFTILYLLPFYVNLLKCINPSGVNQVNQALITNALITSDNSKTNRRSMPSRTLQEKIIAGICALVREGCPPSHIIHKKIIIDRVGDMAQLAKHWSSLLGH